MSPTPEHLRALVLELAQQLDFDMAGVAPVYQFPHLREFADWIAQGRAGEMGYLARKNADGGFLREDIRNVCPWARSVICCGVVYNAPLPRSTEMHDASRGWISRYAWGDDYHEILKAALKQLMERLRLAAAEAGVGAEFKIAVDTVPLVEREAAVHAGLGWQGKNTCLIHPRQGSCFFLGSIITSLDIAADAPLPDRCGSCTRCIEACPTQALGSGAAAYTMDASRCLAYLNIELRGPIPVEFREAIGNNVLGCDICQDVCPWNRKAAVTLRPQFQPRTGLFAPSLEELANLSQEAYQEMFRHSAIKRAKYQGILRNAAVAMGNSRNPHFLATLRRLSQCGDPVVSEHAEWAIGVLTPQGDSPTGQLSV